MPRRMRKRSFVKAAGAAAAVVTLIAGGNALHGAARLQPCENSEFTASIGSAAKQLDPDRLTIVLAGDTGFNAKGAKVQPEGFRKDGKILSFTDSLSGIAPMWTATSFLNLETVVTDRNDLVPDSKGQTAPIISKAIRWG